jgi:hypothetical protein
MLCYECGQPAVAICRWCGVGQCRLHFAQAWADRSWPYTLTCNHRTPDAQVLPPEPRRAG